MLTTNEQTVTVTADALGNVIGISKNNPEYGWIRVESYNYEIDNRGWLKVKKRSALIKGKVEDLKQMNYKEGDKIVGKIVVKESLTPFYEENPEKHMKYAGDTGVVCCVDGCPIYRDTFFTTNLNEQDELIEHDNVEDIKNAISAMKVLKNIEVPEEAEL